MHKKHPHIRIIHRTVKVYWPTLLGFNERLWGGYRFYFALCGCCDVCKILVPLLSLRIACKHLPSILLWWLHQQKSFFQNLTPQKNIFISRIRLPCFLGFEVLGYLDPGGEEVSQKGPHWGAKDNTYLSFGGSLSSKTSKTRVIWVPGVYRIYRHIIFMVSILFGSTLQSNSSILSGAFAVHNWWFGLPRKDLEGSGKGLLEIIGRVHVTWKGTISKRQ